MADFGSLIKYTHGFAKYLQLNTQHKNTKYRLNQENGFLTYLFVLQGEITVPENGEAQGEIKVAAGESQHFWCSKEDQMFEY